MVVICISLTNWQLGGLVPHFIGLENFRTLLVDPLFLASVRNTAVYVAIVVVGSVAGGFIVASFIESRQSLRTFYQAVHFLPFMATLAAMSIAWEAMLHPTVGLVNHVFSAVHLPVANWLADERCVLTILAIIGIWQNVGLAIVLFLAGIRRIPQELYEAAAIDGVESGPDRIRYITVPFLMPVTLFVVIVVSIRASETFDTVRVLTQGGPSNASQLLIHAVYVETFQFLNVGYGAAITLIYLLLAGSLTALQFLTIGRRIHYS